VEFLEFSFDHHQVINFNLKILHSFCDANNGDSSNIGEVLIVVAYHVA